MAAFSLLSLIAIWWLFRAFEMAPYGDKFWAVPVPDNICARKWGGDYG